MFSQCQVMETRSLLEMLWKTQDKARFGFTQKLELSIFGFNKWSLLGQTLLVQHSKAHLLLCRVMEILSLLALQLMTPTEVQFGYLQEAGTLGRNKEGNWFVVDITKGLQLQYLVMATP
jgi:hypothetical protein